MNVCHNLIAFDFSIIFACRYAKVLFLGHGLFYNTLDESPMAYKNMDEIVANIEPTAEIVKRIVPIYNFKAGE